MVQIEEGLTGRDANSAMLSFARFKSTLPVLTPPPRYRMTVVDVIPHTEPVEHEAAVRAWAMTTWEDWEGQHAFIRSWAAR